MADSFKSFITPETLDGNNKYSCGNCKSKQPALKGSRFAKLPYILTLQLKRFGMNWQTMSRVKISTEFHFPEYFEASHLLNVINFF